MRTVVVVLAAAALGAPGGLAAQHQPALARAGEAARAAWAVRDFAALVGGGARIQLQLPGADPSAAVGQAQAVALLRAHVRGTQEVEVRVESAREVGPDRAFVELRRRYRVDGTTEVREERILLGYRWSAGEGGWRLADLRVAPHP